MAYQPRISDLRGANKFWKNYGITIKEHGRSEYRAAWTGGSIIAPSLNKLWEELGNRFVCAPAKQAAS